MAERYEPEEWSARPAVRVICVDGAGRVLLMNWHDPHNARVFWEPPGGGVDPGESDIEAARRELHEETGLPGSSVQDGSVPVQRDFVWLGTRYVKTEPFFLARFEDTPDVGPTAFTPEEDDTFLGMAWLSPTEIDALDAVEPPHLLQAIAPLLNSR
ncbi:NUDIX hydrolase [Actinomadura rupiterrae]|uniref:NUDIX hydrolase n=1 Tax=Actinomadura rupiterrae TaxID=559627 RepID=UPI0020A24AD2|nr:NUDIX domain-containing protein [Actinomadura rupiterrae]MCP2334887.1 8-oxo-dGTP pyrophosphatase MutT (NUDIX family) [Actinomadura rupiterrae]